MFCKEDPPIVSDVEVYTFSGKVYTIIDSQKKYMENVKVFFRDDSTFTDKEGAFSFSEVPSGEYQITFIYTSFSDSPVSITKEVIMSEADKNEEFLLNEQKTFDKDLFPLQVGNVWVYGLDDHSKEYRRIVDTEVIDNITYYRMEIKNPIRDYIKYSNYRVDPHTGYLYGFANSLISDLSLGEGNHELQNSEGQTIRWVTVDIFDKDIFGVNREIVSHSLHDGETSSLYEFVKGIGVVRNSAQGIFGQWESRLFGAIVNNVEYGDTSFVEYDRDVYFYPLVTGNKWFYEYNYTEGADTIRSTRFKREIVGEEVMSNGDTFFKIKNTFDDSLNILYFEWQKISFSPAKLYGFDKDKDVQYIIEDYSSSNYSGEYSESYMPSILPHSITDISFSFTEQTKTYIGWITSGPCLSNVRYEFIKDVGISKIEVSCHRDSSTIIEKINLIGSIINGNTAGIIW